MIYHQIPYYGRIKTQRSIAATKTIITTENTKIVHSPRLMVHSTSSHQEHLNSRRLIVHSLWSTVHSISSSSCLPCGI